MMSAGREGADIASATTIATRVWPRRLAIVLGVVGCAVVVVGVWIGWSTRALVLPTGFEAAPGAAFFLGTLTFAGAGSVLASKRPRNPVGWILLAVGLTWQANGLAGGYRVLAFEATGDVSVPWAAWLWDVGYVPATALIPLLFLLFPDGRLPSRRWRAAVVLHLVAFTSYFVAVALAPGPLANTPVRNPIGVASLGGVTPALEMVGSLGIVLTVLASLAAPVVRYRRASTVQRYQLKWFLAAAFLVLFAWLLAEVLQALEVDPAVLANVRLGPLLALPIATAVAVLRYRLYDIDRIVSRTVSYAFVTLVLAGIYVGTVLLLGGALQGLTGEGSPVVVAGSTLLAAAAFRPLRARVQRRVDRSFNRSRYDAQRAVESFGAHMRSQFDPQGVASDVTTVANRLLRPAHIDLWLVPGLPPNGTSRSAGD